MSNIVISLIVVLVPLAVFGVLYLKDFIFQILGYTRILNLRKDGQYSMQWVKIKNSKSIKVEKKDRILDPKGRFTGPLGNMFVYVGDAARPVTTDDTEPNSEIDVDDVSTITTLAYYAGKLSGMKNFDMVKQLFYINLATLAVAGILLAMYWQDRQTLIQGIKQGLVILKSLATTHP